MHFVSCAVAVSQYTGTILASAAFFHARKMPFSVLMYSSYDFNRLAMQPLNIICQGKIIWACYEDKQK